MNYEDTPGFNIQMGSLLGLIDGGQGASLQISIPAINIMTVRVDRRRPQSLQSAGQQNFFLFLFYPPPNYVILVSAKNERNP